MNIISLSKDRFNTPQKNLVFSANQKAIQKRMIQSLSENLLSNTMYSTDVVELSTIIKDPKKNKIFFATLGSMLTATAMKITELLTGGDKAEEITEEKLEKEVQERVKKNVRETDDKVNFESKSASEQTKGCISSPKPMQEKVSVQKFLKHVGKAGVHEKMLEASVKNLAERLRLDVEHQNSLISLYNKFCGVNNKGVSYDKENKEFANSFVAESIVKELEGCNDIKELENIVSRYDSYSKEKIAILPKTKEVTAAVTNISVPKNIQLRQNIKDAYLLLDETQRKNVDEFLNSINEDERCKAMQKYALQTINKKYSQSLSAIASAYKLFEQKSEGEKLSLMRLLSNDVLSIKALEQYSSDKTISNILNFEEYNSLVYANVPDEAITELIHMRNCCEISGIKKNYINGTFDLKADTETLKNSLNVILKVFNILRNDGSEGLQSNENINIYSEIQSKKASYPNMCEYLDVKENKLNYGKELKLMNIYSNGSISKDLFTLHSYLRFLERYVMPEVEPSVDGKIYSNQIRKKYMEKLNLLMKTITNALRDSVMVQTYTREDGKKAPLIEIPYDNNGNYYTITINEQGKIHTIF